MAGGTFDINQEKIRPGSYINYKSRKKRFRLRPEERL